MNIPKALFLTRYYFNNLFFSKIAGKLTRLKSSGVETNWDKIKNKYGANKTWLVVGNGPSLSIDDLENLSHLPAIASNKITLLYEETIWRPALYTIGDPLLLFKLPKAHYNNIELSLLPHVTYHMARTKNKLAWKSIPLEQGTKWFKETGGLPDPLVNGIIGAKTITTANIQLAMSLGAKTIYLIGCDHNYKELTHNNVKKLEHGETVNHFHPDYRKKGEIVNNAPISTMDQGYNLIRNIADHHGIRIINITRKTALKAFETGAIEQVANLNK